MHATPCLHCLLLLRRCTPTHATPSTHMTPSTRRPCRHYSLPPCSAPIHSRCIQTVNATPG
eukprot:1062986-Rhodomonas_salina.1